MINLCYNIGGYFIFNLKLFNIMIIYLLLIRKLIFILHGYHDPSFIVG